jgi:hypothetical protein
MDEGQAIAPLIEPSDPNCTTGHGLAAEPIRGPRLLVGVPGTSSVHQAAFRKTGRNRCTKSFFDGD